MSLLLYILGIIICFIAARYLRRQECKEKNETYTYKDTGVIFLISLLSWLLIIGMTVLIIFVGIGELLSNLSNKKPPKWL